MFYRVQNMCYHLCRTLINRKSESKGCNGINEPIYTTPVEKIAPNGAFSECPEGVA